MDDPRISSSIQNISHQEVGKRPGAVTGKEVGKAPTPEKLPVVRIVKKELVANEEVKDFTLILNRVPNSKNPGESRFQEVQGGEVWKVANGKVVGKEGGRYKVTISEEKKTEIAQTMLDGLKQRIIGEPGVSQQNAVKAASQPTQSEPVFLPDECFADDTKSSEVKVKEGLVPNISSSEQKGRQDPISEESITGKKTARDVKIQERKQPLDRLKDRISAYKEEIEYGKHEKKEVRKKQNEFVKGLKGVIKADPRISKETKKQILSEIKELEKSVKVGKVLKQSVPVASLKDIAKGPSEKFTPIGQVWKDNKEKLDSLFKLSGMKSDAEVDLTIDRKQEKVKVSELLFGDNGKSVTGLIEKVVRNADEATKDVSAFLESVSKKLKASGRSFDAGSIFKEFSNTFLDIQNANQESCKCLEKLFNKFSEEKIAPMVVLDSEGMESLKPEHQAWNALLDSKLKAIGMGDFVKERLELNKRFLEIAKSQGKNLDAKALDLLIKDAYVFAQKYSALYQKNQQALSRIRQEMGSPLPRFYTTAHPDYPGLVFENDEAKLVDDKSLNDLRDQFKAASGKDFYNDLKGFEKFVQGKGYKCTENANVIWKEPSAQAIAQGKAYQALLKDFMPK